MTINTLITCLQIFGIGFSFGIIGPCFLICTPILITYVAGNRKNLAGTLKDIAVFLAGRLTAYVLLGYLAGLSGVIIRQLVSQDIGRFFRPAAGMVSILLAILVLISAYDFRKGCKTRDGGVYSKAGLVLLGFIIGITPCGPLVALLFEIALISNSALEGAAYALFFGLGTFISGMITVGAVCGLLSWLPEKLLKSKSANIVFRLICAALLILFGVTLMTGKYSYSI